MSNPDNLKRIIKDLNEADKLLARHFGPTHLIRATLKSKIDGFENKLKAALNA